MTIRHVNYVYEFNQILATYVCRELKTGRTLTSICRDEGMVDIVAVYDWLHRGKVDQATGIDSHEARFQTEYASARDAQTDTLVDQITDIADDGTNDYIETEKGTFVNAEHIQRSRLRIDARKWIASKRKPKEYGEAVGKELPGTTAPVVQVFQLPANGRDSDAIAEAARAGVAAANVAGPESETS